MRGYGESGFQQASAQVLEVSEERMVRVNFAIVGYKRTENLMRSFVSESTNAFDVVAHQVAFDVVSRLRQGLERVYWTVCVLCPAVLTHGSGAAARSKPWKGEESQDYGDLEPAEVCPTEIRLSSVNETRCGGSGKGRCSRR